jgi:CYTH domain-containing protein
MAQEIERKFLIESNSFKKEAFKYSYIKQGFLNSHKDRVVRVRILDDLAFITVKGKSNDSGTTRFEWEKEIDLNDAESLLELAEKTIIEKTRYYIKSKDHVFEVDVFKGENEGLVVAEVELTSEKETFIKPEWLGKEVTGKTKYYNAFLSNNPFKLWA